MTVPHIMEYLDPVCYRMLERGGGSWNIEQPGSELQLINLSEPAQPQCSWYLWHNVSSSSLLGTHMSLHWVAVGFQGLWTWPLCHTKAAKLYPHLIDSESSVASVPFHTRAGCQHLGVMLHLLILSRDYQRNIYVSVNLSSIPRELIWHPQAHFIWDTW